MRDIEVCNQMIQDHEKDIPSHAGKLEPIQVQLQLYENTEREKLIEYLQSADFQRVIKQWEKYLDSACKLGPQLERSNTPIRLLASEAIGFRYLKVMKQARKTLNNKNDITRIHILRKSGKKLRYLVDLFSDLYSAKATKKVIKDLKKFQDCLGEMQDSEVQVHLISQLSGPVRDDLTKENLEVIEKIIRKRNKQKKHCHKKAIKLIKEY